MRIDQQYEMQRGPTRGKRRVTLLAKDAPSGRSNWVLVRLEDGVGKGKVIEAPSASLHSLQRAKHVLTRESKSPGRGGPPAGWTPIPGEAVTWTQTLGSRFTVLEADTAKGVAKIEGVLLGVTEQFDALVSELSPFEQHIEVVSDSELEMRLGSRLPKQLPVRSGAQEQKSSAEIERGANFELVSRLVFTPDCIDAYRWRFAPRVGRDEAERRLRHELEYDAERVRSTTKEYVRLQVSGRFEVPLRKRPAPLKPTTVERLVFAAEPQPGQRRKAA